MATDTDHKKSMCLCKVCKKDRTYSLGYHIACLTLQVHITQIQQLIHELPPLQQWHIQTVFQLIQKQGDQLVSLKEEGRQCEYILLPPLISLFSPRKLVKGWNMAQ